MTRAADRALDFLTVGVVAAALVLGGRAFFPERATARADVEVSGWEALASVGRSVGSDDAPVTILEWGDYECPGCRELQSRLAWVLEQHPERVRFVYRHWPLEFHDRARPAAQTAECAGEQGEFFPFHELLFSRSDWRRADDLERELVALAKEAEVADTTSFVTCLSDPRVSERIDADIAAVREIGARGTPAILVNGLYLGSMPDSARLAKLIGLD